MLEIESDQRYTNHDTLYSLCADGIATIPHNAQEKRNDDTLSTDTRYVGVRRSR